MKTTHALACRALLAAALLGLGACSPGVDVDVTVYINNGSLDPFVNADKVRVTAIGIDEASGQPEILKSREFAAKSGKAKLGLIKFAAGMMIKVEALSADGSVVAYGGSALHDILQDTPTEDVPAEIFAFVTPVNIVVRAVAKDGVTESTLPGGRIGHTTTVLEDGRVLITGGGQALMTALGTLGNIDPMTISKTAELYDPESGRFVLISNGMGDPNPLNFPRAFHTATLLPDGAVLLAGGLTVSAGNLATLNSAETFEYPGCVLPAPSDIIQQATCGFIPVSNIMADARGRHTATLRNDGSVLMAGGTNEQEGMEPVYLATTDLYTRVGGFAAGGAAPMSDERAYHTATLLPDGTVLVTGGVGTNATSGDPEVLSSVELYTGTGWMSLGAMSTARAGHTANLATVETGDEWVLVTGGFTDIDPSGVFSMPTSLVESFEPGVGFDPALARIIEGMQNGLAQHTATTLPDGRIVVLGGKTAGNLSTVFVTIITPRTMAGGGPAFLTNPMTLLMTPRALHTAALLPSGQVIAIGGFMASGSTPVTHANAEVLAAPVPR